MTLLATIGPTSSAAPLAWAALPCVLRMAAAVPVFLCSQLAVVVIRCHQNAAASGGARKKVLRRLLPHWPHQSAAVSRWMC